MLDLSRPQAVLGLAVEEGASLGEVTANESTVAQVLECFLSDSNCSLFRSVLAPPLASQLGEGEAGCGGWAWRDTAA